MSVVSWGPLVAFTYVKKKAKWNAYKSGTLEIAPSSIFKFRIGWSDGWPEGRLVILMPLVAPNFQLEFSTAQLSWLVGARCGKNCQIFLCNVFFRAT